MPVAKKQTRGSGLPARPAHMLQRDLFAARSTMLNLIADDEIKVRAYLPIPKTQDDIRVLFGDMLALAEKKAKSVNGGLQCPFCHATTRSGDGFSYPGFNRHLKSLDGCEVLQEIIKRAEQLLMDRHGEIDIFGEPPRSKGDQNP